MSIWRGPGGIEVEAIVLNDRPCLRVTRKVGRRRVLVEDCADVREVGKHVNLAELSRSRPRPRDRSATHRREV